MILKKRIVKKTIPINPVNPANPASDGEQFESRRDGICVEKHNRTDLSPVGATFVEKLSQNTSKTP